MSERIRIDKWLWFARQAKSRTLAAKLVEAGNVRINRERASAPSRMVGAGDVLTLALPGGVKVLEILACGTRRGPYLEASLLYRDLSPEKPAAQTASRTPEAAEARPPARERRLAREMSGKP